MIFLSDRFTSFSSADGNQPGAECWSELDINPRACFHSRSAWEPANEEIGRKIWNFRNNRPKSRLNTRCSKKMTDGPRFEITMDNSQATRRICFENYLRIESNNRTSFVKGTVFISVTGHFFKNRHLHAELCSEIFFYLWRKRWSSCNWVLQSLEESFQNQSSSSWFESPTSSYGLYGTMVTLNKTT